MNQPRSHADYSLTGPGNAKAVAAGLANAEWYRGNIPRKTMKALMQRSDGPATRDTLLWIGLMVLFAAAGIYLWGSWWSVPFWLAYGVLYGSGGDSRWHECGHGTAFATRWKNEAVYQLACFMMMRNPVTWRWSHTRHHTDTIVVGRDPEIIVLRPAKTLPLVLNLLGLYDVPQSIATMLRLAFGGMNAAEKDYVPESEWPKVARVARIWLVIYAAVAALAIAMQSIIPFMVIGLPRFYGAWHHVLTGLQQHTGLPENVLDHRLNCRTVYMNPFSRFIYWNMNYHVEHHMFPQVPMHALPALHQQMLSESPKPYPNQWVALKEVVHAVWRQRSDPDYSVWRTLPTAASAEPRPEARTDLKSAA